MVVSVCWVAILVTVVFFICQGVRKTRPSGNLGRVKEGHGS